MTLVDVVLTSGIVIAIYGIVAVGINIQWGDTGLLNFAQVGLFGVGAYISAILTTAPSDSALSSRIVGAELPIPVAMLIATLGAALIGVIIAGASIRLEDDYLAVVTLSAAELLRIGFTNEGWLTNGVAGIQNINRPFEATVPVDYDLFYFVLVSTVLAGSVIAMRRLSSSPFGRVLHAIREAEDVPQSVGKDTTRFKFEAFAIGSALAGLGGALWAHYIFSVNPAMFSLNLIFILWIGVIVGGSGSHVGVVLGTLFIVGIRQLTRYLPSGLEHVTPIRIILIGALLILVLYIRPYGLLGDKERALAGTTED